ncbi:MAG: hypothetical protein IAF58_11335 [Leptolyngbya sp.]|nr:hypothetical protein [Candidatus Melainabacteria bacterium]
MASISSIFALTAIILLTVPVCAKTAQKPGVRGKVDIKAPPNIVWDAVHKERAEDPDLSYSKVLETHGDKVMLEQKFKGMPIIGEATCLLEQEETINKRIDYKLVRSDKFKELSGSWILTAKPNGVTSLELQSRLHTGLPFSEAIINHILKGRIQKRLERVKASAERIVAATAMTSVTPLPTPSLARVRTEAE